MDSIVIAVGDRSMNRPGRRAAPSMTVFRHLKAIAKQLGVFPDDHPHAGKQRMIVLKVNENYTSQIPSCWAMDVNGVSHPAIPNGPPPTEDRLQHVQGKWSVLQCPHCDIPWDRDENACRYIHLVELLID
jgi:hypothetical protein